MPLSYLPAVLSAWLCHLAGSLDRRSAPRLLRLLVGALLARGRRTVTSWFRAAGITDDFRCAYHALWAVGRRADPMRFLRHSGRRLPTTRLSRPGLSPPRCWPLPAQA
jgi:hypothetical protein